MNKVAKYNTFKAVSTALTFGTPVATMLITGDMFIKQPSTAISGAAVFAFLLSAMFLKDKLAEKFKSPSALVISVVVLALCLILESVIFPVKIICIATIAACGTDELSFKMLYKRIEMGMPSEVAGLKKFGFIAARQCTVDGLESRAEDRGGKR